MKDFFALTLKLFILTRQKGKSRIIFSTFMLEIEKWMEVVQNPETFTESLSSSLCLSSRLPVCERHDFPLLIALYHVSSHF